MSKTRKIKQATVYALIDPRDGVVRYIGVTGHRLMLDLNREEQERLRSHAEARGMTVQEVLHMVIRENQQKREQERIGATP